MPAVKLQHDIGESIKDQIQQPGEYIVSQDEKTTSLCHK